MVSATPDQSQCDGRRPCSRCEVDNSVCSFVSPKKFRNVIHSKGCAVPMASRDYSTNVSPRYVEMLLRQQEWLISGLLKLYSRTQIGSDRSHGLPMDGKSRRMSVHHILEQLGVLDDQNRTALEPVAAPSSDQQGGGVSGDAYEQMPYSPDVDAYDDRCGAFDSIQSESFPHSLTTAASDDLPMQVSEDPSSASFQFPSLVEEESDFDHVDSGFGYRPLMCSALVPRRTCVWI
jgi:hypothetical protein